MLILAMDTSAVVCTASLCDNDVVLASETIQCGRTHSESLLPMIARLYERADRRVTDTDLFAVSAGPGSFTGVRIGVATVKGLAFGHKPCVGVSTLEALAYNLKDVLKGIACPVMDARRGQVYNALFRIDSGRVTRLCEDRAISCEALSDELAPYKEMIMFCGDGYALARESIRLPNIAETPAERIDQNAASVGCLAYRKYLAGESVRDDELRPVYLRQPQAERERSERLKRQGISE